MNSPRYYDDAQITGYYAVYGNYSGNYGAGCLVEYGYKNGDIGDETEYANQRVI